MHYLEVSKLSKSFSSKALFENIDFFINKGDKVALMAKNGAWKSTLLKVLTWELDVSDGKVERRKWIKVEYLSQKVELNEDMLVENALFDSDNMLAQTLKRYENLVNDPNSSQTDLQDIMDKMEELDAREYETKIKTIVSKLRILPYLKQKIWSLSGGELKRVGLARVLADKPDFLILDEPTNHLDLDMIEWLETYLCNANITLLMVTHDRYFLERVCDVILELDRGNLYKYPGNYSYFLAKKAQREEHEALYMKNLRKILKHELAWIRKAPRARASKSVHREKKFYEIEDQYDNRKALIRSESAGMNIEMWERRLGTKICKLHNVFKSFDNKKILDGFSYDFKKRERIGIVGANGVWKSTFVRVLLWEEPIDSGKMKVGDTVTFGYYQQKDIEFQNNQRVFDVIRDIAEYMYIGNNQKISATKALENFLFPASQQHTLANSLSGWEKRRLHLLSILIKNPNFLILDEPTNDLDLLTLGILEEFLLQYQGCLLVISHDRFFMDKIVDRLFVMEWEWALNSFWGTYSEYKQQKKKPNSKENNKTEISNIKKTKTPLPTKKKLSYHEKREWVQLEKNLEILENRKSELNKLFDQADLGYDKVTELSKEMGDIIKEIEKLEERWMELSEWVG